MALLQNLTQDFEILLVINKSSLFKTFHVYIHVLCLHPQHFLDINVPFAILHLLNDILMSKKI